MVLLQFGQPVGNVGLHKPKVLDDALSVYLQDKQIKGLNENLAQRGVFFKVVRIRKALFARGTFPLKDGTKQRKRVSLGLKAATFEKDFALVEERAIQFHLQISKLGHLPSKDWWIQKIKPQKQSSKILVKDAVLELEKNFWLGKTKTSAQSNTWNRINCELKKLPPSAELTADLLVAHICQTRENSNSRVKACQHYKRLGKVNSISGLEKIDPLRADYEPEKFEAPDEEHLHDLVEILREDEKWGWCFASLYVYGCRPSEVFSLQVGKNGTGKVLTIKRKNKQPIWRTCLALPQHCVDSLNLHEINRPWDVLKPKEYDSERARELVNQWGKWLRTRRGHMELTLYLVRHSWAIRSLRRNIQTGLAANCMGHSVGEHVKTYLPYLDQKDAAKVAKTLS